jgi:CheY-like chemotaxis protein
MTTPLVALPLSAPDPGTMKKKRVLLVDASPAKRDLRADVMRKLGMEVDCAADIPEARSWWRADLYDLVLISMDKGHGHRDKFCEDIRSASPPQQLAFFVGKPGYLAASPGEDRESTDAEVSLAESNQPALNSDVKDALAADVGHTPQRWGILEASRRISAVRSASNARTRAMRDRPAPPRDLETRFTRQSAAEPRTLDELLREEMQ